MIAGHLDDKDIAGLICGEGDAGATDHSNACPACAARVEHSRTLLHNFAAAVARSAERPDAEWLRQRSRILAAARARERRAAGWQWALATALLLVAAIGLSGIPSRLVPPPAVAQHAPVAADPNALLTVIAEELEQESPDALAPAALFVERDQDSSAGAHGRAGNRQGERND